LNPHNYKFVGKKVVVVVVVVVVMRNKEQRITFHCSFT
jgi:hypothetical protein